MTLIKYIGKCRRRKGFTLIEVIVSGVLVALIMATVVAFAQPLSIMVKNTESRSASITINKVMGDYIERRIAYANDVTVFVGVPTSDAAMSTAYTTLLAYAKKTTQINNARILAARFVPDTVDPSNNSLILYDIPVTATSPAAFSTFATTMYDDSNKLFSDDFYGGLQYIITCDEKGFAKFNNLTQKTFLNLKIDAFKCAGAVTSPSGIPLSFDADNVKAYYSDIDSNTDPMSDTNALGSYAGEKLTTENISFQMHNINTKDKVTINRAATSTDMLIFYNVRTYEAKKST